MYKTDYKPPLAVLMFAEVLPKEVEGAYVEQWKSLVEKSGFNGAVISGAELQVHHDIAPVLDTISKQYETISRLVEQNAQLIELLTADDDNGNAVPLDITRAL